MKLYFEDDNGRRIEIVKAAGLHEGDVILFSNCVLREESIAKIEELLSGKMKRNVFILDGRFRDIITLPPIRE